MTARLITIPFSHFCEKARWALERCGVAFVEDGHLPLFHYLATYRVGGARTVPVLVDDETVVSDSTAIIAWADAKHPRALVPADPQVRAAALALEDDFDRDLGPATRRWAYFHILPMRGADRFVVGGCPAWEAMALKLSRPVAVAMLRRSMAITPAGVERSRVKIEAVFARVAELLADGRRYLAGDRFSVADLTFAALAAPVLLPEHYPVPLPPLALFGPDARARIEAWRNAPAGAYALRVYAEDR